MRIPAPVDWLNAPERPALAEALRAVGLPRRRPTLEDGRPATKGPPMTRAQKAALELSKGRRKL